MKTHFTNPLDETFNTDSLLNSKDDYQVIPEVALQVEGSPEDIKDADDVETEKKIDEVYTLAIDTFNNQIAYTEIIEPRYAARNAEVAANYLTIALNAAGMKAKVKVDRKKTNAAFIPFNKTTNNNIVVADRNQLLQMLNVDGKDTDIS